MPRTLLVSLLLLSCPASFAQPDPKHPDLCQGAYYTEAQGAQVLRDLSAQYHDQASWEKRATLIRQGISTVPRTPRAPWQASSRRTVTSTTPKAASSRTSKNCVRHSQRWAPPS